MDGAEWARALACRLLKEPLPRRWAHTQGVAAQAGRLADISGHDAALLEAAAWLHDIGYSPRLVATGFHALDGARYLRDVEHADARLCRLVAHHTCAIFEAKERGLADVLTGEFPPRRDELTDPLIYCDMTTGPLGERLSVDERLAEIYRRYGPDHVVSRSISAAVPALTSAVHAVVTRQQAARLQQPGASR
jgi:HD domain